ncbi:MAG: hypothetical protein OEM59_07300 [Rhodospirillales bacterium]|nr:hypothetical protein [Rhodospirillales bacterium]
MSVKAAYRSLRLVVLAGTLALGACGTATPYQPARDGYGYGEQVLEENRYRVSFTGNSLTPRETVESYLLYRAAEVTLARGFDHFIVVDRETERDTTYYSTVTGVGGSFHRDRYGPDIGVFGSSTSRPSSRYTAFANIVLRKGPKNRGDTAAYDARDVLKRLGPSIRRTPAP